MAAKMKAWSGWVIGKRAWEVCHADGRSQTQVRVAILATSRVAVAAKLTEVACGNYTVGFVRDYVSETGNGPTLEALAKYPPGTVLVEPMDPGGTVRGKSGWQPVEEIEAADPPVV